MSECMHVCMYVLLLYMITYVWMDGCVCVWYVFMSVVYLCMYVCGVYVCVCVCGVCVYF